MQSKADQKTKQREAKQINTKQHKAKQTIKAKYAEQNKAHKNTPNHNKCNSAGMHLSKPRASGAPLYECNPGRGAPLKAPRAL